MYNKPYSSQDILNAVFDSDSGSLRITAGDGEQPEYSPQIKIAFKPYGFTIAGMTETENGDLSIEIPGFVFMVTSDTGVVLCNIEYSNSGSSTITFADMELEGSGENESFTAYSFINSDGSVIPMLSKTNL